MDVIYIAGFGRSGSTLVERVIDQVPGLTALGEVRHLWRRALVDGEPCACGESVADCRFWAPVLARAGAPSEPGAREAVARRAARLDRTRRVPAMALGLGSNDPDLREHVRLLGDLYGSAVAEAGGGWLVDSSKEASYAFLLGLVPTVRLRVLHLVRDPRAVAYSWTRVKAKPTAAAGGGQMARQPPRVSAWRWVYQNLAASALSSRASAYVRLRYEDVVADPAPVLTAALARLGHPDAALPVTGHTVTLGLGHSVQGNPFRFTTGSVAIRADDEWRTAMPAADRRLVTLITSPLLRAYGYPLRS